MKLLHDNNKEAYSYFASRKYHKDYIVKINVIIIGQSDCTNFVTSIRRFGVIIEEDKGIFQFYKIR